MAGLFSNYRSLHHADADRTLDLTMSLLQGRLDRHALSPLLRTRDRRLWLEMESSSMMGILIEPLIDACPTKRFILTIRDVFSWFNSWADHHINRPASATSKFSQLDGIRLESEKHPPTRHDRPLTEIGMTSLAAYFALWARHNGHVLTTVPAERILIVRTEKILDRLQDIASFTGVPEGALRPDRGWQYAAPVRHHVLSRLDPDHVRSTAKRFCGDLLASFFPDTL